MDLQQAGRSAMEGKNEAQMAGVRVCMRPDSAASHRDRAQAWISLFSCLPAKVMRIVEGRGLAGWRQESVLVNLEGSDIWRRDSL